MPQPVGIDFSDNSNSPSKFDVNDPALAIAVVMAAFLRGQRKNDAFLH
ncbi:hypothetical protein [Mesorhizobium sp.]|nr:hypothetical protein [Mesorhizobium sp.]